MSFESININPIKTNPVSESLTRAIQYIKDRPNDTFILRMPIVKGSDFSVGDLDFDQYSYKKSFEKEKLVDETQESQIKMFEHMFSKTDNNQVALVELIKSDEDCNISLSMGYTIYEVYSVEGQERRELARTSFLTLEETINYLEAVGARNFVAIPQETSTEDSLPSEDVKWMGVDRESKGDMGITTHRTNMYFESTYQYSQMKGSDAIAMIKSLIEGTEVPEITTKVSRPYKSKLLVIKNKDCEIVLKNDFPIFRTYGTTYQRLLYIYDCIARWVFTQGLDTLKVEYIKDLINQQVVGFNYTLLGIATGEEVFDNNILTTKNLLSKTSVFKSFPVNAEIQTKINAVIEFCAKYNLDISEEAFEGGMEDYVNRKTPLRFPDRTKQVYQRSAPAQSSPSKKTAPNSRPAGKAVSSPARK